MIALGTWSSKGKKEAKQIAAAVLLETMLTSALINPDGVRRPPVASSLSETERERESGASRGSRGCPNAHPAGRVSPPADLINSPAAICGRRCKRTDVEGAQRRSTRRTRRGGGGASGGGGGGA